MDFQQYIAAHIPLVLFGAKATLLWVLANYTYPADPVAELPAGGKRHPARRRWLAAVLLRSFAAACVILWIAGWSYSLGIFTLALAILLPMTRSRIASSYLAELEIGANLIFLFGTVFLATLLGIPHTIPVGSGPASRQMAAAYIVIAIVVFVLRGGSYIVRGVLNKGKTLPEREVPSAEHAGKPKRAELDTAEYSRGRIIGMIERLMLSTFVAMQAYEALAFLLTAKGLFRAKEIEKEEFAEYFLVGTLISSLIAIAAGLAIQFALKFLW